MGKYKHIGFGRGGRFALPSSSMEADRRSSEGTFPRGWPTILNVAHKDGRPPPPPPPPPPFSPDTPSLQSRTLECRAQTCSRYKHAHPTRNSADTSAVDRSFRT